MTGEILTLPLRLSVRAASLLLRGGEEVATRGIALASQVVGIVRPQDEEQPAPPPPAPPRRRPAPAEPAPPPPAVDQPEAIDFDAPVEEEPVHVSEEPELAAEVAEPGAEEGAGSEVRVDEPWPGYRQLHAEEIIARIAAADAAELAAIQLYESAHQRRETVLSAVQRQLALTNRGS